MKTNTIIKETIWNTALNFDINNYIQNVMKTSLMICGGDFDKEPELSVLLTNDEEVRGLNKEFRGIDKPTNVLSFPDDDWENEELENTIYLGDIALAFETIERESAEQNKNFKNHFTHLLVHAMLHLLGYEHEEEKQAEDMEKLEIEILEDFQISNPYLTN